MRFHEQGFSLTPMTEPPEHLLPPPEREDRRTSVFKEFAWQTVVANEERIVLETTRPSIFTSQHYGTETQALPGATRPSLVVVSEVAAAPELFNMQPPPSPPLSPELAMFTGDRADCV